MPALRILALCLLAAVASGVALDLLSALVCPDYFSARAAAPAAPLWLALTSGVRSSWWAGLAFGGLLAVAARAGRRPPRPAGSLVGAVLFVVGLAAGAAVVAGVVGYLLGQDRAATLAADVAERVPVRRHPAFLACVFAHAAGYALAFLAGGVQVAAVWLSRGRRPVRPTPRPAA